MSSPETAQRHYLGAIPGFVNYTEKEHYLFSQWLRKVEHAFELYGFSPFVARPVELIHHLQMKGGIGKQIYGLFRLHDRTYADLGLPFDHTVPLALYVAQKHQEIVFPFKRYDTGWVFRGESPQVGRSRGFIQADIDIIDRKLDPVADFEVLAAILSALYALEIGPITLCLNQIVISKALIRQAAIDEEKMPEVLRLIDKLDKQPIATISEQIHALVPHLSKNSIETLLQTISFRGKPETFTGAITEEMRDALLQVTTLFHQLDKLQLPGVSLLFCPGMVRGLDYYTGIVAETFIQGKESFGSIASGGRYNNLIEGFSEKRGVTFEGVGLSIGLTRLFDLAIRQEHHSLTRTTTADILVGYRTEALYELALTAATALRAKSCKVDLFTTPQVKVGKQLDYANRKGIPKALLIMDTNAFVIKDLLQGSQEEYTSLEEAVMLLKTE